MKAELLLFALILSAGACLGCGDYPYYDCGSTCWCCDCGCSSWSCCCCPCDYKLNLEYNYNTNNLKFVNLTRSGDVDRSYDHGGWVCKPHGWSDPEAGPYGFDHYNFDIPARVTNSTSNTVDFSIPMIEYRDWDLTSYDIFNPDGKLVLKVPAAIK